MVERFMLSEELVDKIFEITGIDYSQMLKIEDLENIIKDLICEYHIMEEKYENKKENII